MERSGKVLYNGTYTATVDSKMRVSFPVDFRRALGKNNPVPEGQGLEVYVGMGEITGPKSRTNVLFAYGAGEWESQVDKMMKMSPLSAERLFFSSANKISVDSLGRIGLGRDLGDYMKVKKGTGLVYIGNLDRIVIMNPALIT